MRAASSTSFRSSATSATFSSRSRPRAPRSVPNGDGRIRSRAASIISTCTRTTRASRTRTRCGSTGRAPRPARCIPAIDPSQPYSIDENGVVESATFMANGAETATLYQNADLEIEHAAVRHAIRWRGARGVGDVARLLREGQIGSAGCPGGRGARARTTGPRLRRRAPHRLRRPVATMAARAATTARMAMRSSGRTAALRACRR